MHAPTLTCSHRRGSGGFARSALRVVAVVVAALLLGSLVGCGGSRYEVTANGAREIDVAVGDELALDMVERRPGCSEGGEAVVVRAWKVTPSRGAKVKGRWFVATAPGVYEVSAPIPPDNAQYGSAVIIRVAGERGDVRRTQPEPEPTPTPTPRPKPAKKTPPRIDAGVAPQADPKTLEFVFVNANSGRVGHGGVPPTFTLKKARRIRLLESYHLTSGAPAGGAFVLTATDGRTLGSFRTNRVERSKSGIRNACWYADVDFVLPAGTYRFVDSDPATWSQNQGTGGTGFCAVSAVRE